MTTTPLTVTVSDPDEPLTVIYDGPAHQAHRRLVPGLYPCTSHEEREWLLTVSEQAAMLVPANDHLRPLLAEFDAWSANLTELNERENKGRWGDGVDLDEWGTSDDAGTDLLVRLVTAIREGAA